ncbi:hypothetical protein FB451DRAFT_1048672, partial [Mycena latifolia]
MVAFLRLYAAGGYTDWGGAADVISISAGKGPWLARRLREWVIAFVKDNENLPTAQYGKSNSSILEDEDLAQEINLHLQGIGQYVAAQDIVDFMATDEMKARLHLKKGISLRTAQRWMGRMQYRWQKEPKGMFADGHEREDVVKYRQEVFLPRWQELSKRTRKWNKRGWAEPVRSFIGTPDGKIIVIWRHDESIFYANDRRKIRWVRADETAKCYAKGEGASMMVAAF